MTDIEAIEYAKKELQSTGYPNCGARMDGKGPEEIRGHIELPGWISAKDKLPELPKEEFR